MRRLILLLCLAIFASCGEDSVQEKVEPVMVLSDSIADPDKIVDIVEEEPKLLDKVHVKFVSFFDKIRPNKVLRDPNRLHIEAGREMGLEQPFRKDADFLAVRDSILENQILLYVEDDTFFRKKRMYHSYPYLTKEAIQLLKELGSEFDKQVKKKRLKDEYALQLTSCLRTLQSQERLRHNNNNATLDTTSHAFGASFDVSYWDFYRKKDGKLCQYKVLQNCMEKAVKSLHNEKKCLVIKETGQYCFHFTVIQ